MFGVVYCMWGSKSDKTRHLGNLTSYSVNRDASVTCGRTIHAHSSLLPLPHAGQQLGHTLLWDGFFNQDGMSGTVLDCGDLKPLMITRSSSKEVAASLHHTAYTKNCYLSVHSWQSSHLNSMIQLQQNLDLLLSITFLHMFTFQCTCCRHQCKRAWRWRAVVAGL